MRFCFPPASGSQSCNCFSESSDSWLGLRFGPCWRCSFSWRLQDGADGNHLFRLCRESANDLSGIFQSGISRALGLGILILPGFGSAPFDGAVNRLRCHGLSLHRPLLQIGRPEQPIFWLTTSFFTGLGHELIALGLVLGGDRLALLLIFFGGCLTAAALFQMARKWMPAGVGSCRGAHVSHDADGVLANQYGRLSRYLDGLLCRPGRARRGASGRGVHAPLADPRQRLRGSGGEHQVHGVDSPGSDNSRLYCG